MQVDKDNRESYPDRSPRQYDETGLMNFCTLLLLP
jgi:hypothetical protein